MKKAIILIALAISSLPVCARAQSPQQQTFPNPSRAGHTLYAAAKAGNEAELLRLFGPEGKELISSGDPGQDKDDRQLFVGKYEQAHRFVKEPDGNVILYLGAENWPFPVPLVNKNGAWFFDTEVGKQEILARKIGKNELSAIQACHELVASEKEHHAGAHPGEAGQYASKFAADKGKHNGLYHPADHGTPEIGPLLAAAGDDGNGNGGHKPFHGYYYRILTGQGSHVPGGEKTYLKNGEMTDGFAFVAYPAEYKSTGVMTFIVNQDGTVYEKDLGPNTREQASSMKEFDPDSSWASAEK